MDSLSGVVYKASGFSHCVASDTVWRQILYGVRCCMPNIGTLINLSTLKSEWQHTLYDLAISDTLFSALNGNQFCSSPLCYAFLAKFVKAVRVNN